MELGKRHLHISLEILTWASSTLSLILDLRSGSRGGKVSATSRLSSRNSDVMDVSTRLIASACHFSLSSSLPSSIQGVAKLGTPDLPPCIVVVAVVVLLEPMLGSELAILWRIGSKIDVHKDLLQITC